MTTFRGKIWKFGRTFVLTVPIQYIKDGHLLEGHNYDVELKLIEEKENVKAAN